MLYCILRNIVQKLHGFRINFAAILYPQIYIYIIAHDLLRMDSREK